MTRIAADRGIPGVLEALRPFGQVVLLEPGAMRPANLAETDILIVRSVAKVGKEMLFGTPIRMVGSATAGTDHVDKAYLSAQNIAFSHAPGANADSVADHVITAILMLAARTGERLRGKTLGIVGYGQVGRRVTQRARGLGLATMVCDPPLEEAGAALAGGAAPPASSVPEKGFHSLEAVLAGSDILTLHTPLVQDGSYPTRHLLSGSRLADFRGWLINTSRGAVVDNAALRHCLEAGTGPCATVLDVWEGEPTPDPVLVRQVGIGTAHVAGYAADSKWEATRQMAVAVARFLSGTDESVVEQVDPETPDGLPEVLVSAPPFRGRGDAKGSLEWFAELAQSMCPLKRDHDALRGMLDRSDAGALFEEFRAQYPGRRLMRRHRVDGVPDHLRAAVESAMTCRCD